MTIGKLVNKLEQLAPPMLQESYDNSGLIVGNLKTEITKVLISFDITELVLQEAKALGANLIISHHPIIFGGLKKLNGSNYVERAVIFAIKNNIALYAAHTSLDNVIGGTNKLLAEKLGLHHINILQEQSHSLLKIVTYVPFDYLEKVRLAMFEAGAGYIGQYDQCSFATKGEGTYRALPGATPFVGEINQRHLEGEYRLETILPSHIKNKVLQAMKQAHPYEEVAYDIYGMENKSKKIGAGIIGKLKEAIDEESFLKDLKKITGASCIRHTTLRNKPIKKVALCGGSGAFLIKKAKASNADIYITGDVKYHEFFDAEDKMIIADVGHYESEQFTCQLLYDYIKENFHTFAVQISDTNTNPIKYL